MGIETVIAFVLLFSALLSFILEKVSLDVTALSLLAIIMLISSAEILENWPSLKEVLFIFTNEAPLTIAAMFVISSALNKSRVLEQISNYLQKFCHHGYRKFMLVLLCLVALVSAFINNTPVVVVLLPVVMVLSKSLGISSSKMLIPVSYASIFGGCCTLMGTSTNILASGIMGSNDIYPQMTNMTMFELSKIGLPLLFLSLSLLVLFGRKLLPEREALSSIISEIDRKEFLTEARILQDSPMIGNSIKESKIKEIPGARVIDVVRKKNSIYASNCELIFKEGDKIILSCKPEGIAEAHEIKGLDLFSHEEFGIEHISSKESIMVEGVVRPSSSIISKTVQEANFRSRFNLSVLAIHRKGKNVYDRMDSIRLKTSDTLLILGTEDSINELRKEEDVILLDNPPVPLENRKSKAPIVLTILLGVVLTASLGIIPISTAAIGGVALLLLSKCVKPAEVYRSIEWNILILIYGMLALGVTMKMSGASALIASTVEELSMNTFPPEFKIIGVLILIYMVTSFLTEILSNNATIVIMAPIALEIANQMELAMLDARAYVLTTCIAASASFITPIGYQTNTFVYSVGGYRFTDFVRVGILFNLIYFFGTILLVSWYWGWM